MPNQKKKLEVHIAYHADSSKGKKVATKHAKGWAHEVRTMTTNTLHDYIAIFNNSPEIISLLIFKAKQK